VTNRQDSATRAFGKRARELRTAVGITQEELGRRASLTQKYLSQIENGHVNPSLDVVHRIAAGLGVAVTALFSQDKPARPDDVTAIVALVTAQPPAARKRALKLLKTFFAE
jgi:transcriptional regulator with XRE-family HTH domain